MLPIEVKKVIDKRWEATRPLNLVRPLIIIDLITYLLFLKRLDELQAFQEKKAEASGETLENPVYIKEQNELRWAFFKNLDRENLHRIFVKESGVIHFVKEYSKGPHIFSRFLKTPLIVTPTPILLESAVSIVKCIDEATADQKGEVYEYLLSKVADAGKGRQLPVPEHIAKLMVEMMEPEADDVVYDPAAGTATFFIACDRYLKEKFPAVFQDENSRSSFLTQMFLGTEQDPALLRIGAMNMILNGIDDPQLEQIDSIKGIDDAEQATLIFANPPLINKVNRDDAPENARTSSDIRPTGLLYLKFILKVLKEGGRAAVIVPESIVLGSSAAHKKMREDLIKNNKLEAVICLPGGLFRPFSGIGSNILVFKKEHANENDAVWFYNLQSDGFSLDDKRERLSISTTNQKMMFPDDYGDITDLLHHWKSRKEETGKENTANSFYVPLASIKENNYDFKSSSYKDIIACNKEENITTPISSQEKISPVVLQQRKSALEALKEKTAQTGKGKFTNQPIFEKAGLLLLICLIGAFISYQFVSKKDNTLDSVTVASATSLPSIALPLNPENTAASTLKETAKEAVTKDNNVINEPVESADKKQPDVANPVNQSAENNAMETTLAANSNNKEQLNVSVANKPVRIAKVRYKVMTKTNFYDAPATAAHRKIPAIQANNTFGALNAVDEKNGFVYVVATNKESETYKGWVPKKDLKKVVVNTYDADIK